MSKLDDGSKIMEARLKSAVAVHKSKIIDEFVAEAAKKGHKIPASAVTKVSYVGAKNMAFAVEKVHVGEFEIKDDNVLHQLYQASWDNNSGGEAEISFEVDKETDDTYTWALTAGIKTGLKVSAGVQYGLPGDSANVNVEASIEASVSVTSGTAHTEKHVWKQGIKQPVPAYENLQVTVYARQLTGSAPFTITSRVTGDAQVKIEYDFHGSRSETPKIHIRKLLAQADQTTEVHGTISGVQGYKWEMVTEPKTLSAAEKSNLPEGLTKRQPMVRTLELA